MSGIGLPGRGKALVRTPHRGRDDGFTVIEILAALAVLAIATTAAVPLYVSGLRASVASKFETQAKNLAQERLESMRNLPFYVISSKSPADSSCWTNPARTNPLNAAGAVECDYKDLLDTYYRSAIQQPSSASTGGYVATSALRSADEIAAGLAAPFYRFVVNPVPNFQNGRFSQVILTQFLNASRQILTPGATYNTQNSNTDFPPSRLVGVTILTRWAIGARTYKYELFSQIAEGATEPTTVTLQAEAIALRLRTGADLTNSVQIETDAGISRAGGALAGGATASTFAQGAWAALTPGSRIDGKYATAAAPPSSTSSGGSTGTNYLVTGTPQYNAVAIAGTETGGNVTAGIVNQQPSVPISAPGINMSRGSLLKASAASDLEFRNSAPGSATGMPSLDTNSPMVWTKGGGASNTADGQTYLKSESGAGHYAQSGAAAAIQQVKFLPTSFAPDGLIQVQLLSSSISCKTTGTSTVGTLATFSLQVKYFTSAGIYQTVDFTAGAPTSLPDPAAIIVNSSPEYRLSQYVRNWSVLPGATPTIGGGGNSVSSSLDGIFRMTTRNTRPDQTDPPLSDDASQISASIGILSCIAEDKRL